VNALIGVLLVVVAATGWALQYIFLRLATDRQSGTVTGSMVFVLASNVVVVVPIIAVVFYPEYGLTPLALGAFVAAGIVGPTLGRIAQFVSTTVIGASRTAPVVSTTALFSAIFAITFLGETLTAVHGAGIVLIVAGVAVISYDTARNGEGVSLLESGKSLILPLLAALALGVEPILMKVGLAEGTSPFVGLSVMSVSAAIGYAAYVRVTRAITLPDLQRGPTTLYVLCGLTSTFAFLSYFVALSLLPVVVVVPILQAAPLLVLVFSAVFLPQRLEHITLRLVAAALVVVVGTTIVSLST
jgi:drug/metabolite transporter (DMT)-like permease